MNPSTTACFSGYRPEKFSFSLNMDSPQFAVLQDQIEAAIVKAAENGYTTFICGMAAGFDLICADMVKAAQEISPICQGLKLIAAIPYQGHKVPDEWRSLYCRTIADADTVEFISPAYHSGCYRQRNRYMVENSSHLICYWDGQEGGTAQTVRMAKQHGLTIHNIVICE